MKRFVLAALIIMAACAPQFAPRGNQTVEPVMGEDFVLARDGVKLPLRHWDADRPPKAVIVALHGMSDYSNAFDMPGRVWAKLGITTLAYDQRGFGRGDHPGIWAGADVMRADLQDAVAAARARYPGVPVFALGESMGGAVVLTALSAQHPPRADASADAPKLNVAGAILVAPAVWSRADMPVLYRLALFLGAHLLPGMVLDNSAASRVVTVIPSDNVRMLRALGRDPLFQKQTRTGTLYGLVNLMDEARNANPPNPPPILLLHGLKDQVIPLKPTDAVIAALGNKATVKTYPSGYHMLLRDLEGEMVDKDVADWILEARNQRQ